MKKPPKLFIIYWFYQKFNFIELILSNLGKFLYSYTAPGSSNFIDLVNDVKYEFNYLIYNSFIRSYLYSNTNYF
jgi:hypothetical protein